ncbi:MAG TPA: GNAT family N-acetyltransferase [Solirubrobacteraceae bacterium]|nr:GNAT family N-acetyltransferase [Solirubrobacteraceae bacterium]
MDANRASSSAGAGESVVSLADGSSIRVRPIAASDRAALADGFDSLSTTSRYRRFLAPVDRLTDGWLTYLTEVDHHDHEALVASAAESGEPVGVARFIRLADEPVVAEAAVAVVDGWQGRGVGSALVGLLAERAAEEGVERLRATSLADNVPAIRLLETLGKVNRSRAGGGVVELEVELDGALGREHPLRAALRRAASGALVFRPVARLRDAGPGGD